MGVDRVDIHPVGLSYRNKPKAKGKTMTQELGGWISNITKTTIRARMVGGSQETLTIASQLVAFARLREVGRGEEANTDLWELSDVRKMDRETVVTWKRKK